jgi:formylglycine-generating enzyme required for sulfatase activity
MQGSMHGLLPEVHHAKNAPRAADPGIEFLKIPAGPFLMGSEDEDANPGDREGPIRSVEVPAFRISNTPVTNEQFAKFANETNYVSATETAGWSFVFHLFCSSDSEIIGESQTAHWWKGVAGANWRRPYGDGRSYLDLAEHPAVHISFSDATAYCRWAGFQLPSEAQWEKAARGGLVSRRFPWGDELLLSGSWQCNIYQGDFPQVNTQEDGWLGTSPVKSFRANYFGGFDFAGNVWEWTSTNFSSQPPPWDGPSITDGSLKVTKGGSYLCHNSFCNRYRVGARNQTPLDSIAGNIGFRVIGGDLFD